MSENQSVVCLRHGRLYWLESPAGSLLDLAQVEHCERLEMELQRPDHRVVFAAPGSAIRLLELEVQPEERRHLAAALPFMLEDSLSEDVESLHFARVLLDKDRYGVAIVAREQMSLWIETLKQVSTRLPWIPEPLLLPWIDGEWTLLIEEESVLVRFGRCEGTRIERSLLPTLLSAVQSEAMPARVVVYGDDEVADRMALPAGLAAPVEWRRGGLATAMLLSDTRGPTPDLLQGDFAPQFPYARWWSQWRALAALLLVALVLHLLSGWSDYRRLEDENLALRADIQSLYRSINPRGAIADVEKQLSRQLDELRGGEAGQSFTALLVPLARLMAEREGMALASLNYNQRNGQLRLNLLAPSFAEVEDLRSALTEAGFETTLENSSRSGGQVRARLRLGTRS